jgi:hypothetical protein
MLMSKSNLLYVNEKDFRGILDVQLDTPLKVKGFESQDDLITFGITTMVMYATNLLSVLAMYNLAEREVRKQDVAELLAQIAKSLLIFSNSINYEIPDLEGNEEFEEPIPIEVIMSPYLSCMDLIRAVTDISHCVHVKFPGALWAEDDIPEELDSYVLNILVSLRNIGNRFNVTIKDMLSY